MKKIFNFIAFVCTFIILSFVVSCDYKPNQEEIQTAHKKRNVQDLMANQPNPDLSFSMDRYILTERLIRFNDPNKMSYLYITLADGSWLKVTIVGKLVSTGKRLTSPEQEYRLTSQTMSLDQLQTKWEPLDLVIKQKLE